jgi:hypothetical protein
MPGRRERERKRDVLGKHGFNNMKTSQQAHVLKFHRTAHPGNQDMAIWRALRQTIAISKEKP